MSQYKPPNVLTVKIDGNTIWTISKCLDHKNWIKLGRELKIPDPKLEEIQEKYKHDFLECAYNMLKIWHERNSTCTVQHLFIAFGRIQWNSPIPKIEKHLKIYMIDLETSSAGKEISKWSNLNKNIFGYIVLNMPIKFYQICCLICKNWNEYEHEFFTVCMFECRECWTVSSFQNALDRKVNCKEIYLKRREWENKYPPTLIKEMGTGYQIQNFSFSNDGSMLAVCLRASLMIYDLKDFSVLFSSDFHELLVSSHFNSSATCILVYTRRGTKVIANAVGLPILYSISSSVSPRRPWLQDDIFLSYTYVAAETHFCLNKISQKGDADAKILKSTIYWVNDKADNVSIIQTGGRDILLYECNATKIAFKIIPENIFGEFLTKQHNLKIEKPDHEIDCKGTVWDYTLVPDGNTMVVYILTVSKDNDDSCFMIVDLVNFELKTSILLVPQVSQDNLRRTLVSNSKYIMCGYEGNDPHESHLDSTRVNTSNFLFVWDLKSGLCICYLIPFHNFLYNIHPTECELIRTEGESARKFKLVRLYTPKHQ